MTPDKTNKQQPATTCEMCGMEPPIEIRQSGLSMRFALQQAEIVAQSHAASMMPEHVVLARIQGATVTSLQQLIKQQYPGAAKRTTPNDT